MDDDPDAMVRRCRQAFVDGNKKTAAPTGNVALTTTAKSRRHALSAIFKRAR
jgi:hypothetical protein